MKKQTYKKMFNVAITTTLAAGAVVAVAPAQTDAAALSFKDLTDKNVHYTNIMELADRGVIGGYADGTYRPSKSVTRGEAAKIIAGVLGLDVTNVKNPNFKDVATTNVYYKSIAALVDAGIINGFEDNTYRPNDTLTRGQMAKIIAFGFDLEATKNENPFKDIDKSIYKDSIIALFENEVTTGKTATTYAAADNVTRAELATFVVRAEKAVSTKVSTVEGSYTIGSVEGNTVKIAGEELEVSSELKAVFNADNAAALQDSAVSLVIEYTEETVASTTPVFAKGKGKIVGIKTLKLVKENTNFNSKGFNISKVEVAAKGITLTNVKAENLVVADKATVTLTGSTVASVEVKGDAKITIGAGTTLATIVLEKGKTLADVVSNYEEVKAQLADVKVVEATPAVTPPATGGGAGGIPVVTETALDKVVGSAVAAINKNTTDVQLTFNSSTNVIEVNVKNAGTTIASIREELKTKKGNLSLVELVSDLTITDAKSIIDNVKTVTVKAGEHSQTVTVSDYINSTYLTVERTDIVLAADKFIDDAIKESKRSVLTLADVKATFANNITITAGTEVYTVNVK